MAVADLINSADLYLGQEAYVVEVVPQGDGRSRFCDAYLWKNQNGEPYKLEDSYVVTIEGKNAAGYNIFNRCTIVDKNYGVVRIPYSNGILSFAGLGVYRIGIYDKGSAIETFNFNIFVTEAPYDVIKLQATDSYEALSDLVANAAQFNKWIEGENPPLETSRNGSKGDLYLDHNTGDIYIKEDETQWIYTGGNIKSKVYIKYSYLDDHSDMSSDITQIVPYPKYIGVYAGYKPDTQMDYSQYGGSIVINPPTVSEYTWTLYRNGIYSTVIEYQSSTEGADPSLLNNLNWSSTIPVLNMGEYLWTRVTYTYDDGQVYQAYSVSRQGVSIKNIETLYAVSNIHVDPSTITNPSDWSSTYPTLNKGEYLYTKFITHSDIVDSTGSDIIGISYAESYKLGITLTDSGVNNTQSLAEHRITLNYSDGDSDGFSIYNGEAAGFGNIVARMADNLVGTPTVTANWTGPNNAKDLELIFSQMKGEKGDRSNWLFGTETYYGSDPTLAVTGAAGKEGDLYINTGMSADGINHAGDIYRCETTGNASTDARPHASWRYMVNISGNAIVGGMQPGAYCNVAMSAGYAGTVDYALNIIDTEVVHGVLEAGNTASNILRSNIFTNTLTNGNPVNVYYCKFLTTDTKALFKNIDINSTLGEATVNFVKPLSSRLEFAVEIKRR